MKKYLLIVLTVSVSLACNRSEKINNTRNFEVVKHPTNENIEKANTYILISDSSDIKRKFNLKLIGDYNSKVNRVSDSIGELLNIIQLSDNNFLILDSNLNEFKIIDPKLNLITRIKKSGRGPGEFLIPMTMETDDNDFIYVLDRYLKLIIYKYSNEGLILENEIGLNFPPTDICIMHDDVIIRGLSYDQETGQPSLFHRFNKESGKYIGSFGKPYISNSRVVTSQLSNGNLTCDENSNSIYYTFSNLPYVYSVEVDGTSKWISEIKDFNIVTIEENKNGPNSITLSPPKDKYANSIFNIREYDSSNLLISVRKFDYEERESSFTNYIVNKGNGAGSSITVNQGFNIIPFKRNRDQIAFSYINPMSNLEIYSFNK